MKVLLVIIFISGVFLSVAYGEPGSKGTHGEDTLVVGYYSKLFFDVDIRDAQAATKVWTDMLVRKGASLYKKSETIVFNDLDSLERELKSRSVDIVVLFSHEFVEMRPKSLLVPVFAADYGKYFFHEMLILVREDSQINRLSGLKQKKLAIETGKKGSIPMMWLETLLMKEGTSSVMEYFSNLKDAARASQAVLPVFFRQADGCVVGRNNFELMIELNPQVGKEMKEIDRSPNYLTGVVCLRKDVYHQNEVLVEGALKALYTEPQGKQIMTLFRVNKLVPYKDEYLESVESLLREHRDLTVRVAQRK